ncbi:MAG: hypothetical protein COA96_16990 [SAR86 cluster bacterium]|uniref:Terminase n=1 Tax=SAR86 cluster bacterium TaxID=2030880 RepID=A0A2A5AGE3_9GAMM|nr:MAG: hypothetical protein COA96_16990 [SAR86 cluster bacterium]
MLTASEGRTLRRTFKRARISKRRTIREWAEQMIVIPDGPFKGLRYKVDRTPYAGPLFDAMDSGEFRRMVMTGPAQSGKSLHGFVIPILYSLFELRETVILGVPTMDIAEDKWREDIYPVIMASPELRRMLPTKGGGSRGGFDAAIQFANGATLRSMSGGGDDASRSHFTARIVAMTEVDKMDTAGSKSREADPVTQLEARTNAYGDAGIIYMECTLSTVQGRTNQEIVKSTNSRLVVECPKCKAWVVPGREHFTGWQDASNEDEARAKARFHCPACSKPWTPKQRLSILNMCRMVHAGQSIDSDGNVVGEPAKGKTLGFRWSAFHNKFATEMSLASEEWNAQNADDEDAAEKRMCQFVWAEPYTPPEQDDTVLDITTIIERTAQPTRGIVPRGTLALTAALDPGKYFSWWSVVAWLPGGRGHVVDYGFLRTPSDEMDVELAVGVSLREFRDICDQGWPTEDGDEAIPDQVYYDSGWMAKEAVYPFIRKTNRNEHRAMKGFGTGQHEQRSYNEPKQLTKTIKHIGNRYHAAWIKTQGLFLMEIDADAWKGKSRRALTVEMGKPGSLSLFSVIAPAEHTKFAKHLLAEQPQNEFKPGVGVVTTWIRKQRQNHWFDTLYMNYAAGHLVGVRIVDPDSPVVAKQQTHQRPETNAIQEQLGIVAGGQYLTKRSD